MKSHLMIYTEVITNNRKKNILKYKYIKYNYIKIILIMIYILKYIKFKNISDWL